MFLDPLPLTKRGKSAGRGEEIVHPECEVDPSLSEMVASMSLCMLGFVRVNKST